MKATDPAELLRSPRQEAFAPRLAEGLRPGAAYRAAGYASAKFAAQNANKLAKRPTIRSRVQYLRDKRASNAAQANERAIDRIAIRKETVARELLKTGTANMFDYVKVIPETGQLVPDFSKMTRDQAAAIQELIVEEYLDGRGENARQVRRTEIKLYNRNAALMNIARMFGWVVERPEDQKSLEARLRAMTPEQKREHSRALLDQLQAHLAQIEARKRVEQTATDAEYQDVGAIGDGR